MSPSVGDSSSDPGGCLARGCDSCSHHRLPHLETGKERKHNWSVQLPTERLLK